MMPVMTMQGSMAEHANASRQDRAYATEDIVFSAWLVGNNDKLIIMNKLTDKTGEKGCYKGDGDWDFFRDTSLDEMRVGLDPGRYLSCTDIIEECNILSKDRLEISFTNTFCSGFGSSSPSDHIDIGSNEHANTFGNR